ncbi:MAG TPA: extracellular solute-binding protein [Patescibacteria group bacterium]|nr:extracellular solute-binding protein [Patescibacteria group bacterium]
MDDNTPAPNQNPTQPPQQTVPLSGSLDSSTQPVNQVQSIEPGSFTPSTQTSNTVSEPVQNQSVGSVSPAEKITLEDLYGPSKPDELHQTAVSQQSVMPQEVVQTPVPIVETAHEQPVETQRRQAEPEPVVAVTQPAMAPEAIRESVGREEPSSDGNNSGGFHVPTLFRFVIGGFLLLIVVLIIWSIASFFLSGNKGSGKVDLVYWGLWENKNVMQPILDDFHKQHPDITVSYVEQDPKDYTKRLLTRMQEGTGPDIFRLHNTWVYPLQSILLPLPTSVLDTKKLQDNYPPVVATDMVSGGALYGLPLEMDTLSLFVNTDIFAHAGATVPTTWDNFITVAKALTVKDPDGHIQTAGAAIGTYDNVSHAPDIVSLLLLQNGANLQKLSGSSNASDALSFYTSFANGDGNVWDNTLDNSLLAFSRGKVAMYFGYSYDILAIQAANPNLKFATYPVPHLPGRDISVASYWAEGISNRSKHQKEAVEFMQYLAQKDAQTQLYTEEAKTRAFGELYALTDLANGLSQNSLLAPFISQFKTAQSSFFAADTDYVEYNGALNQYVGNAINSILKDTSADSALSTLAQGVAQVLNTFAPKTQ